MTRYYTYLEDTTPEGFETISGVQQDGGEFGIGISSDVRLENLNVLNYVGIGTTILSGCGILEVIGTVCATDFNSTSDISLKENVETVSDPLSKVIRLNGVSFDWKETKEGSYGVIAQELEQVFPELVKGNTLKTVNYNGIIAVLIESIKELNQKVDALTKEVNDLKMIE
jgi:hypothetical protein